VIALSQLSRACELRNPPIPQLSDIRESGAIEQDADSVVMLYRQGFYNPDCDDPLETELFLRKNRNGPTGVVSVRFNPERMTFEPLERRNLSGVLESPHPRP
jgi:replicative DNA helicase